MNRDDVISRLRELKPILRKKFAVQEVGLFGSYSNDTHSENSDVDILVKFDRPIGWEFFSLELYLEKVFNRKVDLVTPNALKAQLRDSILQQVKYI